MRIRVAILMAILTGVLATSAAALQGVSVPPTAVAPAKLAYVTGNSGTVWLANADGTSKQRLGPGSQPVLSPDGSQVAASVFASKGNALVIYRPGSPTRKYFDARKVTVMPVAWSPLSRYLAVELSSANTGNGVGLAIVDTVTNTTKTIATGTVCGASFAPQPPDRVVYGRASAKSFCSGSGVNVYSLAVDGTGLTQLTRDGHSMNPVWGAGGIAFDRAKPRRNDFPIVQIWLMKPDGSGLIQLTHTNVPQLVEGLVPLQFSADGGRLLAVFSGQDTIETWTIEVATKQARHLTVRRLDVIPGGLSRDGSTVLIDFGAFQNPPSAGAVETIPFAGGPVTTLVKHAAEPSWNK